jgi:hypothetical protein
MTTASVKPLGVKAYGSIPHLPGSRRGPADHGVNAGQARICTERVRDRHDTVIVQEKLDGSCVAVAKIGGQLHALTRAGWLAQSSMFEQHQLFAAWVRSYGVFHRFDALLHEGERVVGEWLAQAHGTRYQLPHEPFVAFDIINANGRFPYAVFARRIDQVGLVKPHLIGYGPFSVAQALSLLGEHGFHGALDPVEGVMYRVERQGKVDFLAKYVRSDKIDGCYLESQGGTPHWNWRPEAGL